MQPTPSREEGGCWLVSKHDRGGLDLCLKTKYSRTTISFPRFELECFLVLLSCFNHHAPDVVDIDHF